MTGYLTQPWLKLTSSGRPWKRDPVLAGGGQAYDSGAHLLNSLIWTLESSPKEVYAMVDFMGMPVDVNSALVARFESGVLATIVISGNCPASSSGMEFIFAGGRVSIDGWSGSWLRAYDGDGEIDELSCTGEATPTALNFVAAIRGTGGAGHRPHRRSAPERADGRALRIGPHRPPGRTGGERRQCLTPLGLIPVALAKRSGRGRFGQPCEQRTGVRRRRALHGAPRLRDRTAYLPTTTRESARTA